MKYPVNTQRILDFPAIASPLIHGIRIYSHALSVTFCIQDTANITMDAKSGKNWVFAGVSALLMVVAAFLLNGNMHFGLGDEGHLWYGVLQIAEGAVPIMDFRSYDPGRYYWAMAWGQVIGDGILQLRFSALLFFSIGLFLILLRLRDLGMGRVYVLLAGAGLTALSFPSHKLYDITLILVAIYCASLLLAKPTPRTYVGCGLCVGLSAVFARNFGVYFAASIAAITIFLFFRDRNNGFWQPVFACSLGVVAGYLPIALMMLLIPGFAADFIDSIYQMFSPYAAVVPLPIDWGKSLPVSFLYVAIPVIYALVILGGLKLERITASWALLLASAFVGVPVIHHIVFRADMAHLAQGISPLVVILFTLPMAAKEGKQRNLAIAACLAAFLFLILVVARKPMHTALDKVGMVISPNPDMVAYEIRGQKLWLRQANATYLDDVRAIIGTYEGPGENTWIAPLEPGLYPLLGKHKPTWDPYALAPLSEERQKQIITSLVQNNVRVALINNRPLDGLESRRFSKTHGIVWNWLRENYSEVNDKRLREDQILFVKPQ